MTARTPPPRLGAFTAAALAVAAFGCSSSSDPIDVPAADDVIERPVGSLDVSTSLVTTVAPTTGPDATSTASSDDEEPVTTETSTITTTEPLATPPPATAPPATDAPPETSGGSDDVFFRRGDEGDVVGDMQFKLSVLDYLPAGSDDGVFDEQTEQGLRRFQSDYGLGVDGVFGPLTGRALNAAVNSVAVEN